MTVVILVMVCGGGDHIEDADAGEGCGNDDDGDELITDFFLEYNYPFFLSIIEFRVFNNLFQSTISFNLV